MGAHTCLRPKVAAQKLGIGLSTLWQKVSRDPEFPRPVKLGEATTVFLEQEINDWLTRHIAKSRAVVCDSTPDARNQPCPSEVEIA